MTISRAGVRGRARRELYGPGKDGAVTGVKKAGVWLCYGTESEKWRGLAGEKNKEMKGDKGVRKPAKGEGYGQRDE